MRRLLTWKWLGRGAVAVGVLAGLNALVLPLAVRWHAGWKLGDITARLDRDEPGWRWADVARAANAKLPPDDRNPLVLALSAHDLLPVNSDRLSKGMPKWRKSSPNVMLDGPARAKLADAFRGYEPAADVAQGLADLPDIGGEIIDPSSPGHARFPKGMQVSGLALVLSANAELAADLQDGDEAVRCVRARLGLARVFGNDPSWIGQTLRGNHSRGAVHVAERVLNLTDRGEGLAELQAELEREAIAPMLSLAARGSRGQTADIDTLVQSGVPTGAPVGKLGDWAVRKNGPADAALALELLTRCVEIGRLPAGQQAAAVRDLKPPPVNEALYPITFTLVPAIYKVAQESIVCSGELNAAVAGVACERFRRQFGRWPATLADIPKDILPAVPTDPGDGLPIKYQRLADHGVVYSVGPDGIDHGGDLSEATPKETRDYGIRLFDVPHRRQPAVPPRPESLPGER